LERRVHKVCTETAYTPYDPLSGPIPSRRAAMGVTFAGADPVQGLSADPENTALVAL